MRYFLLIIFAIPFCLSAQWRIDDQPMYNDANNGGRHHPITFALDGVGYSLTGANGNDDFTSDMYKFDATTGTWELIGNFPGGVRGFAISDTFNGKAYMGFGASTIFNRDLWSFDPSTNEFTRLADCPGNSRLHPAFVAEAGKIVVGWGNNSQVGNMNDFWMYDIASDTWEKMPDPPAPPRHHPFMFGIDGVVYVGLGHGTENGNLKIYNDFYKWEIGVSVVWEKMDDFPGEARVAGTQFNFGGKGYVLSGHGDDHWNTEYGDFWEYDPGTNTWDSLPPHPGISSRWAPGNFVIDSRVYLLGGQLVTEQLTSVVNSFPLAASSVENEEILAMEEQPRLSGKTVFIPEQWLEASNSVTVFDLNGRPVVSEALNSNEINLSSLNRGTYLLAGADGQRVWKFQMN
ncbi:MAG: hypothetical protein Kapaf2KO_15020 [Candidatus Kapaibacteriales bacterium]